MCFCCQGRGKSMKVPFVCVFLYGVLVVVSMVGSPKPLSKAMHSPTAISHHTPTWTGWPLLRKRKEISWRQLLSSLYLGEGFFLIP